MSIANATEKKTVNGHRSGVRAKDKTVMTHAGAAAIAITASRPFKMFDRQERSTDPVSP
jgi:hypothetical protein